LHCNHSVVFVFCSLADIRITIIVTDTVVTRRWLATENNVLFYGRCWS